MRACTNLGRLDQNTSDAVKTRQEVDLRIGKYPSPLSFFPLFPSPPLIHSFPLFFPSLSYHHSSPFIPSFPSLSFFSLFPLPLSLSSPLSLSHLCFNPSLSLTSGCAFTRFQTMRLRKVFPQVLSDQLISYGPCQFPTLGFVVERVSSN